MSQPEEFDPVEALLRIEALIREATGHQRTAADFYTIEEVAVTFKISRSHAYKLRKEQNWPHHQFGKELRFSAEDIQAIRELNHRKPKPDPTKPAPRIGARAKKK